MDINFKPYQNVPNYEVQLHLKLRALDRFLGLITFRFIPILIMILIPWVVTQSGSNVPLKIYLGLAIIFIIAIYMLTFRLVREVLFYKHEIEIRSLYFFSLIRRRYLLNDLANINLEIYRGGRGAGAYYKLSLKNGKRITLLNLPILMVLNKDKFIRINEKLTELTNLSVEGDVKKLY